MFFVKQLLFLLFAAVSFAGCSSAPEATSPEAKPDSAAVAIADYTNAEGKLLCPVMNQPIDKKEDAVSHQDYEGKRYYFCCKMCPEKFAANPAQYAKK